MTHYTCDECGEVFESEWTDEEAKAEAKDNFPTAKQEDMAIVCDDCYNKIMCSHAH